MIRTNGQGVSAIYCGDKAVQRVYRGSRLVWENDPWLYVLNASSAKRDMVIELAQSDTYISAIVPVSTKFNVTITTVFLSSQKPRTLDIEIDATKTVKTGHWEIVNGIDKKIDTTFEKYTRTHGFDNISPGTKFILFSCAKEMYHYAKVVQNDVTLFDGAKYKPRK